MLEGYLPPIPDDAVPTGERGELVDRLVATIIDCIPSFILNIPQFIPFVGCFWVFLNFPLQVAYYFWFIPYCTSKYGASLGKKMQKLRVVPLGNPTGRIELVPAILRQFGNFFALNLIVLAIKGDERLSLSDLIAKTEVIKVDR
jgi:uncharacterized RDD family membrane protein YckC